MNKKNAVTLSRFSLPAAAVIVLLVCLFTGCGPAAGDASAADYEPLVRGDWQVSTPEAQGLDPDPLAKMYGRASRIETLYADRLFR